MPSQIRPGDLDLVEPGDDAGVGWEPPPPLTGRTRSKQPSKYLEVIARASRGADAGTRPEQIGDEKVQVGPWAYYPTDRKPVVGYEARRLLLDTFGSDTSYHKENGFYYEVLLREKVEVPSSSGSSTRTKGVLWVRRVVTK